MLIRSRYRKVVREINVEIGGTYTVEPLNPLVTKNRGRRVVVIAFIDNDLRAMVKYLDNNRMGKVSLSELRD